MSSIYSLAGTSITTSAYAQVTASSSVPASRIMIVNTTTSIIKIATGASGQEVDLVAVGPSSTTQFIVGNLIKSATRITAEAVDANPSTGNLVVSLL